MAYLTQKFDQKQPNCHNVSFDQVVKLVKSNLTWVIWLLGFLSNYNNIYFKILLMVFLLVILIDQLD